MSNNTSASEEHGWSECEHNPTVLSDPMYYPADKRRADRPLTPRKIDRSDTDENSDSTETSDYVLTILGQC